MSSSIISYMTSWSKPKAYQWHLKMPIICSTFGNISGSTKRYALSFTFLFNDLYAQIYWIVRRENFQQWGFSTLLWKLILRHYFWNYPYPSFLILSILNDNYLQISKHNQLPSHPVYNDIRAKEQEIPHCNKNTFQVLLIAEVYYIPQSQYNSP